MSKLKWIFDPSPPSGREQGGDSFVESLEKSGLNRIELFARESIANSADQKLPNTSSPVKIYIDVISISGEVKEKFKEAIDWDRLKKHLDAASQKRNENETHSRIFSGMRNINTRNKSITLVRVSDYGANGLQGKEDDNSENFHLFSKAMLLTSNDKNRQGSFGLGKGVFYYLSNIRTVLMSSTFEENNDIKTRIFGRCELATHECNDEGTKSWNSSQKWEGPGFFGIPSKKTVPSSESSFQESQSTVRDLFLEREDKGTGTSVVSIDFNSASSASSLALELTEKIRKWFWPALAQHNPEVEIYVREFNNHDCITNTDGKVSLNEQWQPFADVLNKEKNSIKIEELDSLVQQNIQTSIPEDNDGNPKFEGVGEVKVLASNIENPKSEHYALLRNKLCVVNYEKISKPDEVDGNLYGVYLAGKARNNPSTDDELFHTFLRLAEPALHDNWDYPPNIKLKYGMSAPSKFLKDHHDAIKNEFKAILQVDSGPTNENLDHLSEKFQFGSQGKDVKPKSINFSIIEADIIKEKLELKLEIRRLKKTENNWKSNCSISILGHNSSKDNISVKEVEVTKQENHNKVSFLRNENNCLFDVDPKIEKFEVVLKCEIPKIIMSKNQHGQKIDPKKISYKVDVVPKIIN